MSLEVHIYGPGFGETILLRWTIAPERWCGAVVDSCSPQNGKWLAEKIRALHVEALAFVAATHPHLDHIENLAEGIWRSGHVPQRAIFWPPLTPHYWIHFFDELAAQRDDKLADTATQIRRWFNYLSGNVTGSRIPSDDTMGVAPIFESTTDGTPLKVTAIGPWLKPMSDFTRRVVSSVEQRGQIHYEHRDANSVSIALLVEYGDTQVVLGGDMENTNWTALRAHASCPRFRPSVVKVSHHGSYTGRTDNMWPAGTGFFDDRAAPAVAVVTPWRQGGKALPVTSVLQEIQASGFDVFVTGDQNGGRTRYPDSHVALSVESDGAVNVLSFAHASVVSRK